MSCLTSTINHAMATFLDFSPAFLDHGPWREVQNLSGGPVVSCKCANVFPYAYLAVPEIRILIQGEPLHLRNLGSARNFLLV